MKWSLSIYFLLFIFYSFFGWCIEVIDTYVTTKKFVNRGFLIGPICPIYGWGCIFIITLLTKYLNDPIVLLVMSILICSFLEYFTSYIMEKLFNARWWDYSHKKYNINGRVCLDNLFGFGLLCMIMMYIINPFLISILNKINIVVLNIVAVILLIVYIVDNIISLNIISGFKRAAGSIKKDNTEEITKKVRDILTKKGGLYKRLVSAFNFEASEKLIKSFKIKVKNGTLKAKEKINKNKKKK